MLYWPPCAFWVDVMKRILQLVFLGLIVLSAAGCSDVSMPSMDGLFGGDNALNISESSKANHNGPLLKYGASIRILRYTDERKMDNPKKIGTGARYVSGMTGDDILLDQDVATVVTSSMKKHLDDAGFQVTEASDANTNFVLSGVVKELTYNVKNRDAVSISIETTIKERDTGKVLWSGIVVEKKDRFTGISGTDKNDVAKFLRKELGVASSKTTEAISAVLMAVHPELFNMTPGTRPIAGVTVLVAPSTVPQRATAMPEQYAPGVAGVPPPALAAHATATTGLLLVNTDPQRAKVYLDDVYYGLSPLRLEMDPGIHAISVKLEGYRMVTEKVSIRKGDNTEMELKLAR